jgi:hypothetical protein
MGGLLDGKALPNHPPAFRMFQDPTRKAPAWIRVGIDPTAPRRGWCHHPMGAAGSASWSANPFSPPYYQRMQLRDDSAGIP